MSDDRLTGARSAALPLYPLVAWTSAHVASWEVARLLALAVAETGEG